MANERMDLPQEHWICSSSRPSDWRLYMDGPYPSGCNRSRATLQVGQGSLYPALHRLERRGWIKAEWRITDNNRRAKYYHLTGAGRKRLKAETERGVNWRASSARYWTWGWAATIANLCCRIRNLFRRRSLDGELHDELQFHREQEVRKLEQRGFDPAEADRRARIAFGSDELAKEQCRDQRGTGWLENLIRDVALPVRLLRRNPSFTAVALISLAMGIGANTAIFQLVDADGYRMQRAIQDLQPRTLINNRIGIPGDFETPEQFLPTSIPVKGKTLDFDHKDTGTKSNYVPRPDEFRLWETCMTINGTWAYNKNDRDFKSSRISSGPWWKLRAGAAIFY